MINWSDYQYFLHVAKLGSLSAAAKVLGVNHSTVLRRINALEARLGVTLFERSAAGYALTPIGLGIRKQVGHVDDMMAAVEQNLTQQDAPATGTLKISTQDTLGYYWLPRHLQGFCHRHPHVQVDVDITTAHADLSKGEADVLLSMGLKQPDYMTGRPLADVHFSLYAARSYTKEHGSPDSLSQFTTHRFLMPNAHLAHLPIQGWLQRHIPAANIDIKCDKISGLYRLATRGLGLAPLPHYIGNADPMLEKVVDIPLETAYKVWLSTYPDRLALPRVRAFVVYMVEAMQTLK